MQFSKINSSYRDKGAINPNCYANLTRNGDENILRTTWPFHKIESVKSALKAVPN